MTDEKTTPPANDNPAASKPQMMTQQQAMEALITQFCWPVLCAAVNGLRLSLQQIPIGILMVRVCGLFGRVIGETFSIGDLSSILGLRGDCIKAFTEGLRGVKIKPPALDLNAKDEATGKPILPRMQ